MTLVGSHFTQPNKSRYAPIEGEALAIVDALERTSYFVLGCDNLIVAVDHKLLLKVLGDRKLEDIKNPRLLRLKERSLPYKFRLVHIPGRLYTATDALLRHPRPTAVERPDDTSMHAVLNTIRSPLGQDIHDEP